MTAHYETGSTPPGHTLAELSGPDYPAFYPAAALATAEAKLAAYGHGEPYKLTSGGLLAYDLPPVTGGDFVQYMIAEVLADATPGPLAYHLTDVPTMVERARTFELAGVAAAAQAHVLLLLQATYANGGDNDSGDLVVGSAHLLLDLEVLHAHVMVNQV